MPRGGPVSSPAFARSRSRDGPRDGLRRRPPTDLDNVPRLGRRPLASEIRRAAHPTPGLVLHQATFARSTMRRSRSS